MRLPFNSSYPITQPFGVNPADYAKFGMAGHNGIDYGLPSGTPVVAATNGVAYVLYEAGRFGNYIQIVGPQYKTIYAHLQKALITNGALVNEGQVIGLSDNTGNSSGPHLHFGVKPIPQDNNNGYFGAIDPQPILNQGDDMSYADINILRIIHSELEGWPREATHKGEYDKQFLGVYGDKTETNKLILDKWLKNGAYRAQLEADKALAARARSEDWEGQIASLKAQLGDAGTELQPGKYIVK
jgi:hypothetical protein